MSIIGGKADIAPTTVRKWGRQSVSALPPYSDINLFGDCECVIDLNTEISDCAL